MDAVDYIKKVQKICKEFEPLLENCDVCPLEKFSCGFPTKEEDAEKVVEFVKDFVFDKIIEKSQRCSCCGKDFPTKVRMKFCPYCGKEYQTIKKI